MFTGFESHENKKRPSSRMLSAGAWGMMCIAAALACSSAFAELPKIGCRSGSTYGEFYFAEGDCAGKTFYPEGNVFQRIDANFVQCQFNVSVYDATLAESTLATMSNAGYNMVRIWLDGTTRDPNYSMAGPYSRNQIELYPDYMDNVIDFLERATYYNIYVIISVNFAPINTYYVSIFNAGQIANVTGWNTYYYSPGGWNSACTFWEEFATEIAAADGGELVNTILAFEVANEICSRTDYEPFSLTSGNVTTVTGTYNMAIDSQRQSCHDEGLGQYAAACAESIRNAIPDAVCSTSVFTNYAVGHAGFNGLLPRNAADPRWPARIYWFSQPGSDAISYIDIHLYPDTNWSLATALGSMEWSIIDKDEKPFFASEIGAWKSMYPTLQSAATCLDDLRDSIYGSYGFSGQCLYTWDSTGDPYLWSASESSYALCGVLAPAARWKYYEFNGNTTEGWTTANMSNVSVSGGVMTANMGPNSAYMVSPTSLGIDTKYVRRVAVVLKNYSNANGIDLYWIREDDTTWDEDKAIHLGQSTYSNDYVLHIFDLWDDDEWTGTVKQIRVDVGRLWGGGTLSGTTYVDFVRILD